MIQTIEDSVKQPFLQLELQGKFHTVQVKPRNIEGQFLAIKIKKNIFDFLIGELSYDYGNSSKQNNSCAEQHFDKRQSCCYDPHDLPSWNGYNSYDPSSWIYNFICGDVMNQGKVNTSKGK